MPKLYCSNPACAHPNIYELSAPKFCQACGNPFGSTQSVAQILASVVPARPVAQQVSHQPTQVVRYVTEEDLEEENARKAVANAHRINFSDSMSFSFEPPAKYDADEVLKGEKTGFTRDIPNKISKKQTKARLAEIQQRQSTVNRSTIGGEE